MKLSYKILSVFTATVLMAACLFCLPAAADEREVTYTAYELLSQNKVGDKKGYIYRYNPPYTDYGELLQTSLNEKPSTLSYAGDIIQDELNQVFAGVPVEDKWAIYVFHFNNPGDGEFPSIVPGTITETNIAFGGLSLNLPTTIRVPNGYSVNFRIPVVFIGAATLKKVRFTGYFSSMEVASEFLINSSDPTTYGYYELAFSNYFGSTYDFTGFKIDFFFEDFSVWDYNFTALNDHDYSLGAGFYDDVSFTINNDPTNPKYTPVDPSASNQQQALTEQIESAGQAGTNEASNLFSNFDSLVGESGRIYNGLMAATTILTEWLGVEFISPVVNFSLTLGIFSFLIGMGFWVGHGLRSGRDYADKKKFDNHRTYDRNNDEMWLM